MEIRGIASVGSRTKDLVRRLRPGDIAIIDHQDIDEVAADSLIAARVKAVINAAPSISGRYPNKGPRRLLERGIPLLDNAGPAVMALADGAPLAIEHGDIFAGGRWVARATPLDFSSVDEALAAARENLSGAIHEFIDNTLAYAEREKGFFARELCLPALSTDMRGKHVLLVVRGQGYREDLRAIDSYIREMHPVLVGVDGGADALLEAGFMPHMIVGDMDSVSDAALTCRAELVVHAYLDGRAPGALRVAKIGREPQVIRAPGTSEDLALLMAYQLGAELIVAVGTHSNIVDFLEKGRPGMASTFLVRLKVGSILVDAKGVSQLYRGRPAVRYLVQVAVAALAPILLVGLLSDYLRQWVRLLVLGARIALGF